MFNRLDVPKVPHLDYTFFYLCVIVYDERYVEISHALFQRQPVMSAAEKRIYNIYIFMPFSGSFGCSVEIFIIRSFFAGISANELCYQWVFRLRTFF